MVITLIIFIVILSVLIFVHEFGHYITAIRFGIRVEEFGLGFPPRIFGWQIRKQKKLEKIAEQEEITVSLEGDASSGLVKEVITDTTREIDEVKTEKKWRWIWGNKEVGEGEPTVYSLNWIPIGGFVKIKGENGEEVESEDSFSHKTISRRVAVLAAGVIMNLLLCIVLLIVGFSIGMPSSLDNNTGGQVIGEAKIQVMELVEGMPAKEAGIKPGDVILAVDNQQINTISQLQNYLAGKKDQTVAVKLSRGSEELNKDVIVKAYRGTTGIGVSLAQTGLVRYPWYLAIWQGIKTTFLWLALIVVTLALLLKNLIFGLPSGVELAGPVGIAVLTGDAAKLGWIYLLQFAALLSVNLAFVNILPIPALDGGRILFLIIEKVRGKAIKQKWENLAHNIGFILLMILIVLITYRDVLRYGGRILSALKGLVGM